MCYCICTSIILQRDDDTAMRVQAGHQADVVLVAFA
jgi:hypothetical protein